MENEAKYLDLARELKKLWKVKVTVIAIMPDAFGTVQKILKKIIGRIEDQWKNPDHSDQSTFKISKNY